MSMLRPAIKKWYFSDSGEGRPLVLLHGIGMSHKVWNPVLPLLVRERRVLAFDIAGFGNTPPLPSNIRPTIPHLVEALAANLQYAGIVLPVDIAGNSQGGLMALEAARLGIARSVVAISPAGLWEDKSPLYVRCLLKSLYRISKVMPFGVLKTLMRPKWLRELLLDFTVSPQSGTIPFEDVLNIVRDLSASTAFIKTFDNTGTFEGGKSIPVPITIAFGKHDRLLRKGARRKNELPAQTKWLYPESWGHVPMWTDPEGVAGVILEGTR